MIDELSLNGFLLYVALYFPNSISHLFYKNKSTSKCFVTEKGKSKKQERIH